jgi:hypothetical protein
LAILNTIAFSLLALILLFFLVSILGSDPAALPPL